MDDILYYLGFNRVSGIGPARLDRLVAYCGSLAAAWQANTSTLMAAGLDSRSTRLVAAQPGQADVQRENSHDICAVTSMTICNPLDWSCLALVPDYHNLDALRAWLCVGHTTMLGMTFSQVMP